MRDLKASALLPKEAALLDINIIQETKIQPDVNPDDLTIRNYKIEIETSLNKARTAIYVSNNISYNRKPEVVKSNKKIKVSGVILDPYLK